MTKPEEYYLELQDASGNHVQGWRTWNDVDCVKVFANLLWAIDDLKVREQVRRAIEDARARDAEEAEGD